MDTRHDIDDRRLEELLAPLRQITPVPFRQSTMPARPRRRRARILMLAAVIAILATAAAVGATRVFGPLHDAELVPPAGDLTCAGIIGEPATKAESYLRSHGFTVSWHLERFGTKVVPPSGPHEPTAIEGGRSIVVSRPPTGSILFDVARVGGKGSHRVVAAVIEAGDPNAPRIEPPADCGS